MLGPGSAARALACAHRCEALLRLRRLLNEPILDQLPVLPGLRRALEELALGFGRRPPGAAPPADLILEQVGKMRASRLHSDLRHAKLVPLRQQ